jgi:hypothetical protein
VFFCVKQGADVSNLLMFMNSLIVVEIVILWRILWHNLALEPMLNVLDGLMKHLRLYLIWWPAILLCIVVNGTPV